MVSGIRTSEPAGGSTPRRALEDRQGTGTRPDKGSDAGRQTGSPGGQGGGSPREGFKQDPSANETEIDPRAQAIIRRLPVREENTGKTRGLWFGRDGSESPLVSGYDRYQEMADRYADERLGLGPLAKATHVEIKFAMFMRERGLRDETIYLNNDPCKGPASCRRWLGSFLPPGAKLTIHWPDGGPETFDGKS
ncbi:hypothetical protein E0H73_08625 [Kribbella pittospori]|uniref:Nucleic acid/nucleotide deaminase of polymorphic system toxin n=2 Tax=Kribbella pittospori TaxID=722689 RepID=A0A4R0KUX9_9ACTN|nr:hypothetical protein E0H73_08625 [Kribbella pittospori]